MSDPHYWTMNDKDAVIMALCSFILKKYGHVVTDEELKPYMKKEASL